jgi:hypothetical protein
LGQEPLAGLGVIHPVERSFGGQQIPSFVDGLQERFFEVGESPDERESAEIVK